MANIKKIKEGTATIYPATIPQAVVDPTSGKTVRTELDERATSAELSQLAGDVSVKIENLVENGDFRNGTTGWTTDGGSTVLMSGVKLRVERTTGALVAKQTLSFIGSNRYYVSITNVTTDMPDFYVYMDNFTRIDQTGYSCIHTPLSSGSAFSIGRLVYTSGTYFEVSSIKVINLTATFGAGNEPTKEEFELLLATLGIDYFEGEITIPAQKIMQWQLKLIRKNKNAIIVLGGTII